MIFVTVPVAVILMSEVVSFCLTKFQCSNVSSDVGKISKAIEPG